MRRSRQPPVDATTPQDGLCLRVADGDPSQRGLVGYNDEGRRVGETHANAQVRDAVVNLVRTLHEDAGWSARRIADEYGLRYDTVRAWIGYRRRAHVAREWRRPKGDREDG